MWFQLVLVGALILLNGAFAGTEMALVSLREGQLNRLEQRGRAGRRLVELARDPNRFLAAIQVGITAAGFLASATAAVSLARPLEPALEFLGGAAKPGAVVLVTLVLTYLTLVLGELAPKRLAMQRAERWALMAARPLAFVSLITRPAVWFLAKSSDVVVRLFGGDPRLRREEVTEEEIRDLIAAQESIPPEQRSIIAGAFEIDERRLWSVLRHRSDVLAFEADTPVSDARRQLVASGHSRAPVHAGGLDHVIGVVHLRDLVEADGVVGDVSRPPLLLPETLGVLDALRRLQAERAQLALVVDEHGGIEGIVTVEDLLEEIVGEIYDEFDRDLGPIEASPDGSLELPGTFPAHDLVDLGVHIEPGRHATLAGLVYEAFGRVPAPGDRARLGQWEAEVLEMDGPAIERLRLRRAGSGERQPT
ncbi:MAG: hemolysin family protein [Acidimicrobiales bacterium]